MVEEKVDNIFPIYDTLVSLQEREERLGYKTAVFWFMGLSGSGKSAIARRVERGLHEQGYNVQLLDGDNIRDGLNAGLSFSPDDRAENIRRIAEVSKLMMHAGVVTLCSFITPTHDLQELAKRVIGDEAMHLIFVDASLKACMDRDPKGLYQKAKDGLIKNFTGISAPFEHPESPRLHLINQDRPLEEVSKEAIDYITDTIDPR